jgi:hypothetical protein
MEYRKTLDNLMPKKIWFTLKEACELKNLNYKTSCNKKYLQPKRGEPDGKIGGRKVWSRKTILDWILQLDNELEEEQENE